MAQAVQSLNSIDFSALIGGPLVAAVKAQMEAALASVDFIKQVGFEENTSQSGTGGGQQNTSVSTVRYVEFTYERNGQDVTLKVPILSIVPVPFVRIESIDIEFLANITAVEYEDSGSSIGGGLSGGIFKKFFLRARIAGQKYTRQGSRMSQKYAMSVKVRAVQDEMPSGLERILDILEDSIKDQAQQQ